MAHKHVYISLFLFVAAGCLAQDPLFTNTQQSLVYLNPSFAGSNGGLRIQSLYRSQTPLKDSPYKTFYNGVDFYVKAVKAGMSFTYLNDDINNNTSQWRTFTYSYAQYLSLGDKLKIIPSLQAGFVKTQLDRSQLNFGDVIDPRHGALWITPEAAPQQTKSFFDLSSGLLANYLGMYFGASVFHFNQPNIGLLGDQKLPARLSLYGSYNTIVGGLNVANLSVRYEHQANFDCAYLNVRSMGKYVLFGLGYNSKSVGNLNLGYRSTFFTLSLGYDNWFSAPTKKQRNAWELQFSFNIRDKDHRKKLRVYFEQY